VSSDIEPEDRLNLVGMFCAALEGRDVRWYILAMDSDQCARAHNVLKLLDDQLKRQWTVMGGPGDHEGEEVL
jgi:hypothetical protein